MPRDPETVKLIIGFIYAENLLREAAEKELSGLYGNIDGRSEEIKFDSTDYYFPEMGPGLMRRWVSFERPVGLDNIYRIKQAANAIEQKYSVDGKRKINIDPGYINGAKLALFSTKDFSHRIYLAEGIYAEVTLLYKKGSFCDLEWTYPDYKLPAAKAFFTDVRKKYLCKKV